MLTAVANSMRAVLDAANPASLASAFQALGLGQLIRQDTKCSLHRLSPDTATDPYVNATYNGNPLPDDAKACSVLRAYSRAGGVTGALTPVAFAQGTHPATGEIAVAPNGDIATLEADEITDLDVVYMPERCDVAEFQAQVVAGSLAIPAQYTAKPGGVLMLMEAESLAATTTTGKFVVTAPAATNTSTATACLDVAMQHVLFDATDDGVTLARVKIGYCAAIDPNALLEGSSPVV